MAVKGVILSRPSLLRMLLTFEEVERVASHAGTGTVPGPRSASKGIVTQRKSK